MHLVPVLGKVKLATLTPMHVAQQLAGHADSRMTKEVYTHVTDAMMRAAAEAIEQATDATVGSPGGSPDGDEEPDDAEGDESDGADLQI